MLKDKIKFNQFTKILNSTFEDLLDNPESNSRFVLGNYFEEKNLERKYFQINISSKYNNKNNFKNIVNINNLGVGEIGYAIQLFKIFKNDDNYF